MFIESGSYDIYNGDTITIQSKYGDKVIDTEMSKDDFFKRYQDNEEETK